MKIYYDEEGDFLEITVANPPKKSYCEDIDDGVFIRKDENTDEVIGVWILNFKARTKSLEDIKTSLPFKLNITC